MPKTKHPLYGTWVMMIDRCHNPRNVGFHNYGGRGIGVCQRWRDSFWNFVQDMPPRPKGHTLDRIDNNDGYRLENCAWRTSSQNSRNMRSARMVVFRGKRMHVAELADLTGIEPRTLYYRITQGWPASKVVSKKPQWNNAESQKKAAEAHAAKAKTKTHCLRGHALSGENLYLAGGRRHCRTCRKLREQGKI